MDITGTVSVSARFRETIPAGPGNARPIRRYHRVGIHPYRFTYGTGPGQANLVWTSTESITVDTYSTGLYLGSLFHGSNGAAFDTIRFMMIRNLETESGRDLIVGGSTHSDVAWIRPWSGTDPKQAIPPSSSWAIHNHLDGWPVDGEQSVLGRSIVAGSVAMEIIIVGVGSIAE